MPTAIDSARVEIDNDCLVAYIHSKTIFPSFFPCFSFTPTYSFSYRCLLAPQGTKIHRNTEMARGRMYASSMLFTIGNKRNFRTGTHVGRASQVKGIPTSGG